MGNETWFFLHEEAKKRVKDQEISAAEWSIRALIAYADAMRNVDPDIQLIFDGKLGNPEFANKVLGDQRIQKRFDMLTLHRYQPGGIKRMIRNGNKISHGDLSNREKWYAWVSMPAHYDRNGRTAAWSHHAALNRKKYPLACTEWNWNGWSGGINETPTMAALAQGLGAAGFLHGLMRQGDRFQLATQSMLVGTSWNIAAIKAGENGDPPPFIQPTGMVTGFYRAFHGDRRLSVEINGTVERIEQNLVIKGWGKTKVQSPLPLLDVLSTRDDESVYLHVIHRRFDGERTVKVNHPSISFDGKEGTLHWMGLRPRDKRVAPRHAGMIRDRRISGNRDGTITVKLPARSVSILELPVE